jgi:hypothetical protein
MFYGGLVILDYFRNYVPIAPDLTVEAVSTVPMPINIKEFLLQGARDQETHVSPDPFVLQRVPVQRGWRLRAIITEPPRFGSLTWNPNSGAFTYTARVDYEGYDCFTYTLTNGFQKSLMAKVDIDVIKSYTITIPTIKGYLDGSFDLISEYYQPPDLPVPLFKKYEWYYKKYKTVVDVDGVPTVKSRLTKFYETDFESNSMTGNYPRIIDSATTLTNWTPETNEGIRGVLEGTQVPYRADIRPYEPFLLVRLYFFHRTSRTFTGRYVNGRPTYYNRKIGLDYSRSTLIDHNLNLGKFGANWFKSGNIDMEQPPEPLISP